jgi:hypothetical protein
MPLARYLLWVGGTLFALLLLADSFLPRSPIAETDHTRLPTVRIHSDRKWPERIVFDTNLPTIIPVQSTNTEADSDGPPLSTNVSPAVREALARTQQADAKELPGSEKAQRKRPQHQRKVARRPGPPAARLAARQPQFGWFGMRF